MKKLQAAIVAIILSIMLTPAVQASALDDVKFLVENHYYGDVPQNLKTMETVDEITKSLDAYSYYMTKKSFDAYMKTIGDHTPLEEQVAEITNPSPTVSSRTLYGNTGYIKIANFSTNMDQLIAVHWNRLQKNGAQRLILDLRDNLGGFVESADQLLGFFSDPKSSYYIYTRSGQNLITPTSNKLQFPKETYILINRKSASASEIVAVSVKDQQLATLVGEKTYGKGSIQSFYLIGDGGSEGVLRLTTGEFRGPKGTFVNKTGITPEIATAQGKELTATHRILLETSLDNQHFTKLNPPTVNPNTSISIELPRKMNFLSSHPSNRIELVRLGGEAVSIQVTQTKGFQSVQITPQEPLDPEAEYIAILHPETKHLNGKRTRTGLYTIVSPSADKK